MGGQMHCMQGMEYDKGNEDQQGCFKAA